jgi:hypothetical protein
MTECHFRALRAIKQYHHAHIFVFPESNYSVIEAGNVADIVTQHEFAPVHVETQQVGTNKARLGVMTQANEKKMYAQDLAMVLSNGQLQYPLDMLFVSQTPVLSKDTLLQQLRTYRRETKMTNNEDAAFAQIKETYSGKGGGRKDDLCMALQIAVYHGMRKRISKPYAQLAENYGWRC